MLKYLPEKLSGWPCVRWPPCARFMPRMVSPGLQRGQQHRHVGLRAGVRLHVGVFGAEERLGALDGQRLDHVDVLAAAVVALARIAFGVLVGEHRAGRFEHRRADEVLGGDQLEAGLLPLFFVRRWRAATSGSALGERAVEAGLVRRSRSWSLGTRSRRGPTRPSPDDCDRRAGRSWRRAARAGRRRTACRGTRRRCARRRRAGAPRAEREDVQVVVLAGQHRARRRRRSARRGCRAPCWRRSPCPTPLPQTRMPRSARAAGHRVGHRHGVVGIVDRRGRGGAEVVPGARRAHRARA